MKNTETKAVKTYEAVCACGKVFSLKAISSSANLSDFEREMTARLQVFEALLDHMRGSCLLGR
jgi:hypothetical protein